MIQGDDLALMENKRKVKSSAKSIEKKKDSIGLSNVY